MSNYPQYFSYREIISLNNYAPLRIPPKENYCNVLNHSYLSLETAELFRWKAKNNREDTERK